MIDIETVKRRARAGALTYIGKLCTSINPALLTAARRLTWSIGRERMRLQYSTEIGGINGRGNTNIGQKGIAKTNVKLVF